MEFLVRIFLCVMLEILLRLILKDKQRRLGEFMLVALCMMILVQLFLRLY